MLAFTVIDEDGDLSLPDVQSRISFPTCEDLGIPRDQVMTSHVDTVEICLETSVAKPVSSENPAYRINGYQYDSSDPRNPFSPVCRIPLPSPIGCYEYGIEPAFIRKRNERERERVRCVNEGYAKLREHLPLENKEKRISKVETLRGAIKYIRHLQSLLRQVEAQKEKVEEEAEEEQSRQQRKRSHKDFVSPEDSNVKRLCTFDIGDELVDTDSE